ncbi:hypothetical protein ACF3MZ_00570 [Paenibacillaceae bacterium WGS1546]|uniref:hypothetical protein n=1 Tax=Cohnella sp. WGS1546 TaxID=3366810 RepID=UPI00372D5566
MSKAARRLPPSRSRERGTSGSVSIYFIVATASFFLLTALLIDFARVAAFRKEAELAVKSGVRSVLSSYDPLIYARYGLFIRGGEPADELFRATLEGNSGPAGDGFAFLDTRWENAGVTESRPLASHDIFRREILEEMKYKAPIDLALEVASRFRGVSGTMKEARKTVDLLERMRKAYDRREKALDETMDSQRDWGEKILRHIDSAVGSASGVVGSYEDYVAKRKDDESRRESLRRWEEERSKRLENGEDPEEIERSRPDGPRYEAEVAAYEANAAKSAAALEKAAANARSESESFAAEANAALAKARQANDEMAAIVAMSRSMPDAEPDRKADGEGPDAEHIRTMEELRRSAEDLVLKPEFFADYEAEIARQRAQGLALASEAGAFASWVGSAPGSTGLGSSLRQGESRLNDAISAYAGDYGAGGKVIERRREIVEAHRSGDDERKREEAKAKSEWAGAAKFLGSLTGLTGSEEEQAGFDETRRLFELNLEWNQAEADGTRRSRSGDPSEGRDEAMASSNALMDTLEGALTGARDQLYYSEYALGRLSHFSPASAKKMLGGEEISLSVHEQETEYVLYGLHNPAANIAAAYGEIFAFRLAIRTMEGLIECRTLGHPLLVLAASLVYGISKAASDMRDLLDTGKIQLSKYLRVDTFYTDYLRLFMLAHGGSGSHASRMIAVMEHASGLDFRGAYTYASGEGTASVSLWFFPGLLRAVDRVGNMGGTVKGNRYEATYTADSSYL